MWKRPESRVPLDGTRDGRRRGRRASAACVGCGSFQVRDRERADSDRHVGETFGRRRARGCRSPRGRAVATDPRRSGAPLRSRRRRAAAHHDEAAARRPPPRRRPRHRRTTTTTSPRHRSGTGDQNGSLGQLPGVPRRQRVEHATSRALARRRELGELHRQHPRQRRRLTSTPTSAAAASTASRTSPCPATSRRCRSTSSTTATRATPARTRSRSTRRSRVAATATCSPIDRDNCKLYELFNAHAVGQPLGRRATARSSTCARTRCARRAGRRPTRPGCRSSPGSCATTRSRAGHIDHALRFTVSQTQRGYIHPATHYASSSTDPNRPPMGLRLRLQGRASTSRGYPARRASILEALKKYGMIVADNGSNWFITGAADSRWNDDDLNQLKTVPGSAFEVVDTGPVIAPLTPCPPVVASARRGVLDPPGARSGGPGPGVGVGLPAAAARSSRRPRDLVVVLGGVTIADTRAAYRVLETSHPPNYYFPPDDVRRRRARPADGRVVLRVEGPRALLRRARRRPRRAPRPRGATTHRARAFAPIRGYVAFYAGRDGRVLRRRRTR